MVWIGGIVILMLGLAWWFFVRTTWQPVLTNIEPQDAADAAKILQTRKIAYRLEDGGRTLLVATDAADQARVDLASSELPMRGQVGFELFNQSDMGLTEFAQKINYQRALQGELARTILTLDGVSSVRVHLGLPDRTVFRGEQSEPKASVTLLLKPGHSLTEATVLGVQRLVAGAIPDMVPAAVAVLDGEGRIVSGDVAAGTPTSQPQADSDALIQNWQREVTAAIRAAHPDVQFVANISLRFGESAPSQADATREQAAVREPVPRGNPDYALAVRVTTEAPLDEARREDILHLVNATIGFSARRGDSVEFLTGPLVVTPPVAVTAPSPMQRDRVVYRAADPAPAVQPAWWERWWPAAAILAALALAAAWWNDRRRMANSRDTELDNFAQVLQQRLDGLEPAQ